MEHISVESRRYVIFTYAEVDLSSFETVHINVIHDEFVVEGDQELTRLNLINIHASFLCTPHT